MRKKHMIKNRKKEKRESKGKRNNHMVRKKDHILYSIEGEKR